MDLSDSLHSILYDYCCLFGHLSLALGLPLYPRSDSPGIHCGCLAISGSQSLDGWYHTSVGWYCQGGWPTWLWSSGDADLLLSGGDSLGGPLSASLSHGGGVDIYFSCRGSIFSYVSRSGADART